MENSSAVVSGNCFFKWNCGDQQLLILFPRNAGFIKMQLTVGEQGGRNTKQTNDSRALKPHHPLFSTVPLF